MFDLLKLRKHHGHPLIADLRAAQTPAEFRGFPLLDETSCSDGCTDCISACPTDAIAKEPLRLDLGRCIFCADCERACPDGAIHFSPDHRLAADKRANLWLSSGNTASDFQSKAISARYEIHKMFGRSLKLRQVSAGGCNGCETELGASGNVNFDMERFGIDFVPAPRHADGIVLTGPITKNMAAALTDAWEGIAGPKVVIAVGACAISGGLFAGSPELNRNFMTDIAVDLYIPGCPPHPLTFINALLDFLGK